jgi:bifunctional ADP-heptose synthase (sugar kinase/adenylyltransferase)
MNLYIINNVLSDYTSGMVVIAAESKEMCRELFIKEFSDWHAEEFDKYATFTVIEGVNHAAGLVDHVYGGS